MTRHDVGSDWPGGDVEKGNELLLALSRLGSLVGFSDLDIVSSGFQVEDLDLLRALGGLRGLKYFEIWVIWTFHADWSDGIGIGGESLRRKVEELEVKLYGVVVKT